jgi:uncharacterized repeat protein (TIGR03847 family)
MAEARQFGQLIHIEAESIGQPGQRRFRLRTMNEQGETAALWLEKEQLSALGEAIETALRAEEYEYQRTPLDDAGQPPVMPLDAHVELQLAQLSLGLDRESRLVVLIAADGPDEDDDTVTLTMSFDYRRSYELRRQIVEVVAAGRRPCPLCTAPMDPSGHVCVKTNGHQPH